MYRINEKTGRGILRKRFGFTPEEILFYFLLPQPELRFFRTMYQWCKKHTTALKDHPLPMLIHSAMGVLMEDSKEPLITAAQLAFRVYEAEDVLSAELEAHIRSLSTTWLYRYSATGCVLIYVQVSEPRVSTNGTVEYGSVYASCTEISLDASYEIAVGKLEALATGFDACRTLKEDEAKQIPARERFAVYPDHCPAGVKQNLVAVNGRFHRTDLPLLQLRELAEQMLNTLMNRWEGLHPEASPRGRQFSLTTPLLELKLG